MDKFSYIANAHSDYIEGLYEDYQKNPDAVDASWKQFFEGFEFAYQFNGLKKTGSTIGTSVEKGGDLYEMMEKEIKVRNLIQAYRSRGHLEAKTNPVRPRKDRQARLQLADFGLSQADLNTVFVAGNELGMADATLSQIVERLEKIYKGAIGFEYNYVREPEILEWFKKKVEVDYLHYAPSLELKKRILSKLNEAVVFENFLQTRFIGQKRFSLEGGESTIAALDAIINTSADLGVKEVIMGMAHRGRLNVLTNIMRKTYEHIFTEFEGGNVMGVMHGSGDVKYHMGYSSQVQTPNGKVVDLKLTPNPSHLEAVNPVVAGFARAKTDIIYKDNTNVLPILVHGDAAVAGQGIIYELIQMSNLEGYTNGGTIHFVINNQVGFTTDFEDARSSIYCTDITEIVDSPVLHVNGDDPEAVVFAAMIAAEYRQTFQKDIFIDMVCYRRLGHNESDEPKFTQPVLYNIIAKHPNPREVYKKILIERGDIDADLAESLDQQFRDMLQDRFNLVKEKPLPYKYQKFEKEWKSLRRTKPEDFESSPVTGISEQIFEKIAKTLTQLPETFKPIKQIEKLLKDREKAFFEEKTLNWAAGELMAHGSILLDGKIVRLSGQDVQRGTFSHRHAVMHDAQTNESYNQLAHLDEKQGNYYVYNSLLSEYGVLGYEYGYAMANPHALVIWEAQFGDFANGAQIMIDQFIASSESKWQRMTGLVMQLPHGYEGQGPEHSSARPERFLQLCAEYNMIVANITTPANFFHLLRRQLTWHFRKPCVVMSPKSLLRHPKCVSDVSEILGDTCFQEVIGDTYAEPSQVKTVVLCTGKVFYDIQTKQHDDQRKDVAVIRLEQIHPFPKKQLESQLAKYNKDVELVWLQEEPENMGYWAYLLRAVPEYRFRLSARKASASPATGFAKVHLAEQEEIVQKALGNVCEVPSK